MSRAKKIRVLELGLVVAVAYLPALTGSLLLLGGSDPYSRQPEAMPVYLLLGVIREAAYIALLLYVLFRQGRRIGDLGFTFRWRDVPAFFSVLTAAAVLAGLAGTVYYSIHHALPSPLPLDPLSNIPGLAAGKGTVLAILLAVVSSFAHQLIYGAYAISELEYLTGRKSIAVIGSVVLQVSYHLSYGLMVILIEAIVSLVLSLYYVMFRRIWPAILVSLGLNLLSVILYYSPLFARGAGY